MNKIILQLGLLVFFLSIIYFSQKGVSIEHILLNSFVIFIILTTMLSFVTISFIKAINKNTYNKINGYSEDLVRNNENE